MSKTIEQLEKGHSLRGFEQPELESWKILIADKDEQTHLITELALSDIPILDRQIDFYHAYTSEEAYSILQKVDDMTVLLLDIVMETESAGLDLVYKIREELKLKSIRIIIRTGEASFAPELDIIQQYDINDFKMKSELTRDRLISTLTTAVRSYEQYNVLEQNSHGMEQIINCSQALSSYVSRNDYSGYVLNQVNSILNSQCQSFLCYKQKPVNKKNKVKEISVIAASAQFENFVGLNITNIDNPYKIYLEELLKSKKSFTVNDDAYIFLENDNMQNGILFIRANHPISEPELQLLKVYGIQVSIGFGNQNLLHKLHKYAYFDRLCHIPNRTSFLAEMQERRSSEKELLVALIDIDHFSEINNAMGYQNGDILLKSISVRLTASLNDNSMLARIGDDTFSILGQKKSLDPEKLLNIFNEPFFINGTSFPIKATIGFARVYPIDTESEDILKNADMAMKIAKKTQGIQHLFYRDEMGKATQNRITITRDLRKAIEHDELVLHFQPQLNLETKELIGAESLIRWQRPNGELVPPSQFIPIAEQSGLIIDIGEIAIRKSIIFLQNWIKDGNDPIRIGINVSVRQFHSNNFSQFLKETINEYDIDPSFLELEITESMLVHDVDMVIEKLNYAKELGLSIAIDDFGTGFSSLSYLLKLPIDRLKIDRSFIINLENDPKAQKLTKLIVRMGKELDLDLIAEGVENHVQANFLNDLKCDEVQGFLYSKPLDEAAFLNWKEYC